MNSKTNSCSLWYGFIFNLLVALCTIGFMCYFFHRFDSRLVSLERRVWEKQRGGKLDTSWNTGYFYQANSNGEAVLRRKARKGGKLKHLNTELGKILNKKERGSWSETGELWYWKRLSLKHMKGHWFYLTPYQGVCLFTCLPTDYVTLWLCDSVSQGDVCSRVKRVSRTWLSVEHARDLLAMLSFQY